MIHVRMTRLAGTLLASSLTALLLLLSMTEGAGATPVGKPVTKNTSATKPANRKTLGTNAPAKGDAAVKSGLVLLKIEYPRTPFYSSLKPLPPNVVTNIKPEPLYVPEGTTDVALHKPVTSSDERPIIGTLSVVTDGDKEANRLVEVAPGKWESEDWHWVEVAPGKQWVQIDLEKPYSIYAINIWHYFAEPRVYFDVVVQIANDPKFRVNVRTIYNNDRDNSLGLGAGKDQEYMETYRGWLVQGKGAKARYVRLYSSGNTSDENNHYTEVEVYGK